MKSRSSSSPNRYPTVPSMASICSGSVARASNVATTSRSVAYDATSQLMVGGVRAYDELG